MTTGTSAIVDWLVKDFKNSYGIDLSKDKMALQRLRETAEKAKIELSSSTESQINLPYITHSEQGPLHLDTKLTRAEFQKMTSDLLDRCKCAVPAGDQGRRHQAQRHRTTWCSSAAPPGCPPWSTWSRS